MREVRGAGKSLFEILSGGDGQRTGQGFAVEDGWGGGEWPQDAREGV